jgi:protein required for attachment to host cells
MSKAWVVVADASRARIFEAAKPASELVEIQTLAHPEARLHEGDLVSDRPGTGMGGGGGTHAFGSVTEAKEEESIRFAADVCEQLEQGRARGAYEKLYIIAAPTFLGLMRKRQSEGVRMLVTQEISKNLAAQDPRTIRSHLPTYL